MARYNQSLKPVDIFQRRLNCSDPAQKEAAFSVSATSKPGSESGYCWCETGLGRMELR